MYYIDTNPVCEQILPKHLKMEQLDHFKKIWSKRRKPKIQI